MILRKDLFDQASSGLSARNFKRRFAVESLSIFRRVCNELMKKKNEMTSSTAQSRLPVQTPLRDLRRTVQMLRARALLR
jgi:hypothetical protein